STPETRAALERRRRLNLRQAQQTEGETLSLDGIVRRSDGSGTAWINGRPHYVADPRNGVAIGLQPGAAGASISVGDEPPSRLRVGESINRGTRESIDILTGGRVSVRSEKPTRRISREPTAKPRAP
ncbi:MAG: hypothetical protein WCF44_21735, partial [Candidatus Methylophosphatis roskildensis]